MGEITYQGEPPFHLATTQPASVHAFRGIVVMTVYASVHGKGPADFPVRLPMPPEQARQLIADLRQALIQAEEQQRGRQP